MATPAIRDWRLDAAQQQVKRRLARGQAGLFAAAIADSGEKNPVAIFASESALATLKSDPIRRRSCLRFYVAIPKSSACELPKCGSLKHRHFQQNWPEADVSSDGQWNVCAPPRAHIGPRERDRAARSDQQISGLRYR